MMMMMESLKNIYLFALLGISFEEKMFKFHLEGCSLETILILAQTFKVDVVFFSVDGSGAVLASITYSAK